MNLEELVSKLPDKHQEAFRVFVETGEASEDFLQFLDENSVAQAAVEEAFGAQAAALDGLREAFVTVEQPTPLGEPVEVEDASPPLSETAVSGSACQESFGYVYSVVPESTVEAALDLMDRHNLSQLPVISAQDQDIVDSVEVVGSVEYDDLTDRIYRKPSVVNTPVEKLMGRPYPVVDAGETLGSLESRLKPHKFLFPSSTAAVVRDNQTFVGFFTRNDVLQCTRRFSGARSLPLRALLETKSRDW